jgi:hypothetical protein
MAKKSFSSLDESGKKGKKESQGKVDAFCDSHMG